LFITKQMQVALIGSSNMSKNMYISILVKEPNKNPKTKRIRNTLEDIQIILKGKFDLIEYDNESFIAYNYKSKSKCQIQIGKHILNGTIIVIGNDEERGDFTTLRKEQIKEFEKEFANKNTKIMGIEEQEM